MLYRYTHTVTSEDFKRMHRLGALWRSARVHAQYTDWRNTLRTWMLFTSLTLLQVLLLHLLARNTTIRRRKEH